jgi:DNA-binding CsgD family transcriptional regulator
MTADHALQLALRRAREHYDRQAWAQAFEAFAAADRAAALGAEDLERLAMSAYLVGLDEDYLDALERAHDAHLHAGKPLRGARCAFWLGLRLLLRGDTGRANGWLTRAERLIEADDECVERGYLLLPVAEQHLDQGDAQGGYSAATEAVGIAERFSDRDLLTCARHLQGRSLLQQGEVVQGLALLDEAMVAVAAGHLSPIVTGLMYCSIIAACMQVYAFGRAREWTFALAHWCERQPELVSFTSICLIHRAEILQLHGSWRESITEAQRACERCAKAANRPAEAAAGFYQAGEVHRLRGEFAEAEQAYRDASQSGLEPQPGLALLRLAQGRTQAAAKAIRRVVAMTKGPFDRSRILPACVDILLVAGDLPGARDACRELEKLAADFHSELLDATAAHAQGAIRLTEGESQASLLPLRRAWQGWQRLDAPYQAARTRVLISLACRALGDDDGMELELDAARTVFERLEAVPDLAQVDAIRRRARTARYHGLTRRELQVLRLVAAGKTNRDIAKELSVSERTVDRHVSNIFSKLAVRSRSAATSYAYRHDLI